MSNEAQQIEMDLPRTHHVPLRKEFTCTWRAESVKVVSEDMTDDEQRFFDGARRQEMILPDGITYMDLLAFVGQKTKVTIELLPW